MIYFKIGSEQHQMPSTWREMDTATFVRLSHLDNDYADMFSLMAALTNIDKDKLLNAKSAFETQTRAALKLVADEVPLWEQIPHKDQFIFKGKAYKVPKNLEMERFGQKVMLQNRLLNNAANDCLAFAVALYMQPIIDGKFNNDKILPLEEEILKMPAIDIYPLAVFFLNKLKEYKTLTNAGLNPFH